MAARQPQLPPQHTDDLSDPNRLSFLIRKRMAIVAAVVTGLALAHVDVPVAKQEGEAIAAVSHVFGNGANWVIDHTIGRPEIPTNPYGTGVDPLIQAELRDGLPVVPEHAPTGGDIMQGHNPKG